MNILRSELDHGRFWQCRCCNAFAITRDEIIHFTEDILPLYLVSSPSCSCPDSFETMKEVSEVQFNELVDKKFEHLRHDLQMFDCGDHDWDHFFAPEDTLEFDIEMLKEFENLPTTVK